MTLGWLLAALALGAGAESLPVPQDNPSPAAQDQYRPEQEMPRLVKYMLKPTQSGFRALVPVVDTDPNIGTTGGVMVVWVTMANSQFIRFIQAPSVTYNQTLGLSGKYEVFYYPSSKDLLQARLSLTQRFDREAVVDYNTSELLGRLFYDRSVSFNGRFEYSKDSSQRFFGFGPAAPKSGESNLTLDTINYRVVGFIPVAPESPVSVGLLHGFQANDVGGSFSPPPDIGALYPTVFKEVQERHHNPSLRAILRYDTRDSDVTTSRGNFAEVYLGGASKRALSDYNYYRYGAEAKSFFPTLSGEDSEPGLITAARARFETLHGAVPFWLMPSMGGKYSHRGYGEGRWHDNGSLVLSGEERIRVAKKTISGTVASLWLDPFFAYGSVFSEPQRIQAKYLRPVFGAAVRLIARPQIAFSCDFGVGQEGLKVFLDINYSY